MIRPLRAALAALIIGPALALAPTLTASADPISASRATVGAQAERDMSALHTARVNAGEISDSLVAADQPKQGVTSRAPHDSFYAPYECNPWRNLVMDWGAYCFHTSSDSNQANDAILWTQQHMSRADRQPVPFPELGDGGGGSLANKPHTTYVVKYSSAKKSTTGSVKATKVFKYGITSKPHYQDRANVGRRACNAWAKKKGYRENECERTWVAVNKATYGWDNARWLEASLIKQYELKNGKCPPGQPVSCK